MSLFQLRMLGSIGLLLAAGAVLAAKAFGDLDPAVELSAGLVGGLLAAGSHATKAGTRVLINTSPEPFTNIAASVTEDVVVMSGLWAAAFHPWLFFSLLAAFVALVIWALPRIWGALKRIFAAVRRAVTKRTLRVEVLPPPQLGP